MENSLSPPAHLSVSIVLYNSSLALLRGTLSSLFLSAQRARDAGALSTVTVDVIDNGSEPDYGESVQDLLNGGEQDDDYRLNYHHCGSNLGFGGGNNLVVNGLASDFHLILNPDVALTESALETALSRMRGDSSIVLLSPHVSSEESTQEYLCKRYPSVLVLLLRAFAPEFLRNLFHDRLAHYEMRDVCAGENEAEVVLASGCFMLLRTDALRECGGFDERYFLYFEDFDLSLRLAALGRLIFDPTVKIVHHGGYAASKGFAHIGMFIKSGIRFFNTHGWRWI